MAKPFDIPFPEFTEPSNEPLTPAERKANNFQLAAVAILFTGVLAYAGYGSHKNQEDAKSFALKKLKESGVNVTTPADFKKYEQKIDSLESIYQHKLD